MNMIRCFVACGLPRAVLEAVEAYQRRLEPSLRPLELDARWARPASLHLTLRFLGEIDDGLVDALGSALRGAVADQPAFSFRLGGLGCFPDPRRPRVLWLGAESPGLAPLHDAVQQALESLGLPPPDRPFFPHITLARLKTPRSLAGLLREPPAFDERTVPVGEVLLYRSELSPKGGRYTVLRRAALAGAAK